LTPNSTARRGGYSWNSVFFNRRLKFCSLIGEEKQVAAKMGITKMATQAKEVSHDTV
jgi:hypothetical protein